MTKVGKSPSVPKAQREIYEKLAVLTDAFCAEHLNKHYAHLARQALAALSRKRPNPLNSGKSNTWACGVLYALGQHNFLFDKDSKPYIKAAELCGHFNIAPSTGQNKSRKKMRKNGAISHQIFLQFHSYGVGCQAGGELKRNWRKNGIMMPRNLSSFIHTESAAKADG